MQHQSRSHQAPAHRPAVGGGRRLLACGVPRDVRRGSCWSSAGVSGSRGWIERHYIEPDFFFKYYGFEWIEPWSGSGMYWHFAALALLSLLITLGVLYRLSTVAVLSSLQLRVPARSGALPQPLLSRDPDRIPADGGSGDGAGAAPRCRRGRCGCSACSSR